MKRILVTLINGKEEYFFISKIADDYTIMLAIFKKYGEMNVLSYI